MGREAELTDFRKNIADANLNIIEAGFERSPGAELPAKPSSKAATAIMNLKHFIFPSLKLKFRSPLWMSTR